jgi:hypothetical protein
LNSTQPFFPGVHGGAEQIYWNWEMEEEQDLYGEEITLSLLKPFDSS